jgi:hypothetical protein
LADLLQKVAWLLPVVAWLAPAAPFSHRVHLQQKLTCAVCHTTASKSVKAEDNLLPNRALCAGCHKDSKQVKTPRKLTVTKFNHALHAKFDNIGPTIAKAIESKEYLGNPASIHAPDLQTNNACTSCHRGMERSDDVSPALFPHMADCLVCHNRIDVPFSCSKCHTDGPHLKPASHTNDWIDRHNSSKVPKDKQSCAVCHGRRFTCQGCH